MSDPKPSVGRIVHYVSRGSADGVFESMCRAAIVTDVPSDAGDSPVGLAVFHRDGLLFAQGITYNEPGETAGNPDCPDKEGHGTPFRYCACGWIEAAPIGGTWHWPERV